MRPDGQAIDPDNRLLWRQARLRLDAELIRDAALTCSGLLDAHRRRAERLSASARRRDEPGPDEAAVAGRYRARIAIAAGSIRLLAGHAPPVPDDLRRSRRRADLHAAVPIQHAAPGPDPLNDPAFVEIAQGLAARIVSDRPDPPRTATGSAMRSCSAWAGRPRAASSRRWKCPDSRTSRN